MYSTTCLYSAIVIQYNHSKGKENREQRHSPSRQDTKRANAGSLPKTKGANTMSDNELLKYLSQLTPEELHLFTEFVQNLLAQQQEEQAETIKAVTSKAAELAAS